MYASLPVVEILLYAVACEDKRSFHYAVPSSSQTRERMKSYGIHGALGCWFHGDRFAERVEVMVSLETKTVWILGGSSSRWAHFVCLSRFKTLFFHQKRLGLTVVCFGIKAQLNFHTPFFCSGRVAFGPKGSRPDGYCSSTPYSVGLHPLLSPGPIDPVFLLYFCLLVSFQLESN